MCKQKPVLTMLRLGKSYLKINQILNRVHIWKSLNEAAESCTIDGESPVVESFDNVLSRVAWGT